MWSLLESGAENGFNYQAVTIHLWQNIVLKSIAMYRLYRKYIILLFIIVFTTIISMTLCVITILRGNCTCELYVHVFICIYIYIYVLAHIMHTFNHFILHICMYIWHMYVHHIILKDMLRRSINRTNTYTLPLCLGKISNHGIFWDIFFLGIPVWQT